MSNGIFAKRLRFYRQQKELTQEELALRVGLDASFISKLERQVSSPTLDMIYKCAKALGIKAKDLLE